MNRKTDQKQTQNVTVIPRTISLNTNTMFPHTQKKVIT